MSSFAAVDLGAASGRVAVGTLKGDVISYEVVHRFPNGSKEDAHGRFTWDWHGIINQVEIGLKAAVEKYVITSVGVDTWAVDYVLLNDDDEIIAPTYSYRDQRTAGLMEIAIEDFGKEIFYEKSGIQFQPFNTVYQLLAARDSGELKDSALFLMLPDALNMRLTGAKSSETTNASTTQLLNTCTREWNYPLIEKLGLPERIFPKLHESGYPLGTVKSIPELRGTKVVAVGSHDTASAVAGAPIDQDSIYISSGTWSLIGCELRDPITSKAAMSANLTNELGVEGTVRLQKNVSGMWIISECLREWREDGESIPIQKLVELAKESPNDSRIDPNNEIFLHPGKMVERIQYECRINGYLEPLSKGEIAYCVYASLSESYARSILEIETVTGRDFENIHVVGGGSANDFLNQLTADKTGLPVIAGPAEATILGNVGVQAIAAGEITNLQELRKIIANSYELRFFQPSHDKSETKGRR
jgi:rhamnulokinase